MILIATSTKRWDNKKNPKEYPYWKELISLLNTDDIIQIGTDGDEQFAKDFRKNKFINLWKA
jgi:hypothetical protein